MKLLNGTRKLLKASVVLAIALAFVLPAAALNTQTRVVNMNANTMGRGQWIEQASGFTTASRGIRFLDAIDNDTAWAIAYDGSGGGCSHD